MENLYEIREFGELVKPALAENQELLEYKTKLLTQAGDNYGSLMLAVETKLRNTINSSKNQEILELVVKMCPPNEWIKQMFQVHHTFKKEVHLYRTIVPTLQELQKENGVINIVDIFPECYGARISLNPNSSTVDDDAAIVLENLKLSGYEVVDRMVGFDLQTAELLVRDLAVFHALPIALKLQRPEVFKRKVLPYLQKVQHFEDLSEEIRQGMNDDMIEFATLNPKCIPLVPNIKKAFENFGKQCKNSDAREPFATMCHNDYWVNNTMLQFSNGKPIKNKMVDFQLIDYGSPGKDLVFFLFSSVQKPVLDENYDKLIRLYYKTFIATLDELKCETDLFTFEKFQEEIKLSAQNIEFYHVMIMMRFILSIKGTAKNLSEVTEKDFILNEGVSDLCKQRIGETVLDFAQKGWI